MYNMVSNETYSIIFFGGCCTVLGESRRDEHHTDRERERESRKDR